MRDAILRTVRKLLISGAILHAFAIVGMADPELPPGAVQRLGSHRFVHADRIRWLSFTPDDRRIFSQSDDGICVWDVETGKRVWQPPRDRVRSIMRACLSEDGRTVFVAASGKEIGWTRISEQIPIRWMSGASESSAALAITPDGKLAATGDRNEILIWSLEKETIERRLQMDAPATGSVNAVALSPDGKFVAGGVSSTSLWRIDDGTLVATMQGSPNSIAFGPDSGLLAVSLEIREESVSYSQLKLFELSTGNEKWQYDGSFNSICFSPDGSFLAGAGHNGVTILEVSSGKVVRQIVYGGNQHVQAAAFSHDGKLVAAGGDDARIRLWRTHDWSEIEPGTGHEGAVRTLSFSPDGKMLATGGQDGSVRFWSLENFAEERTIRDLEGVFGVAKVMFSPDGAKVASCAGRTLWIWKRDSAEEVCQIKAEEQGFAFTSDSTQVIAGMDDGSLALWSLATGSITSRVGKWDGDILDVQQFPGRDEVLWIGKYGTWGVRDLRSGEDMRILKGPSVPTAIAADGSWMARGDHAWETDTGKLIHSSENGSKDIAGISADGRFLAWEAEGYIHVWHRALCKTLHIFGPTGGHIYDLKFSPDGTLLASAGHDGCVLLWDMAKVHEEEAALSRRPAVSSATETAFRKAAAELSFISYGHFLYNRDPRIFERDAFEIVVQAWIGLEQLFSGPVSFEELAVLADDADPKVRTLAMLGLYALEDKRAIPIIHSRLEDNSITFPAHAEMLGRSLDEPRMFHAEPQTVQRLAYRMLQMMGCPSHWKDQERPRETFGQWCAAHVDNPDWIGWYDFLCKRASRGISPVPEECKPRLDALREQVAKLSPALRVWIWLGWADDGALIAGKAGTPLATEAEILDAARQLGPHVLLAFLRDGARAGLREPYSDDPMRGRRFILAHAKQLFREEDAGALLMMGEYIAAADARPAKAAEWLRAALEAWEGEHRSSERGSAVAALLDHCGDKETDFIAAWFYHESNTERGSSAQSAFLGAAQSRMPKEWMGTLRAIVTNPAFEQLRPMDVIYAALLVEKLSGKQIAGRELLQERFAAEIRNKLREFFGAAVVVSKRLSSAPRMLSQPLWSTPIERPGDRLAVSKDGTRAAVGLSKKNALLFDARNGVLIAELPVAGHDIQVYFQQAGGSLITYGEKPRGQEWSSDGKWIGEPAADSPVRRIGKNVIEDPAAVFRDWPGDPARLRGRDGSFQPAHVLAISHDGARILFCSRFAKSMQLWDAHNKKPIAVLAGHSTSPRKAYFSPDGALIISTGEDTKVILWDGRTGAKLHEYASEHARWSDLAFTQDSRRFIAKSADHELTVFDCASGDPALGFKMAVNRVCAIAVSVDGKQIFTLSDISGFDFTKSNRSMFRSRLDCWPLE